MSDDQITVDEIRGRLEKDGRIPSAAEIAVSVKAGDATLRGSVESFPQRRAAVEIAKATPGVRRVENELRVDLHANRRDDEIRGAAIQALISSPDVPAERIEVTVDAGWLTLKGEVKHQQESNAAFDAVSEIPGIGGITNKIAVVTYGIDG
jgi:osmotically-inducible protein OsmY